MSCTLGVAALSCRAALISRSSSLTEGRDSLAVPSAVFLCIPKVGADGGLFSVFAAVGFSGDGGSF